MAAQLFLFEPRRYGLWSEMDRRVQGLYSSLEDAIIRRQTGGRFEGARRWSNTRWQVETGGLGKRAITALVKRGFVRWDADDLVVVHYDPTWEVEAAKRSARLTKRGKEAANTRWQEVRRRAALARGQAAAPNFLPSKKSCDRNEDPTPVSSAAPGSTPCSKLSPKPAELLTPTHASGNAKRDARARLLLQDDDPLRIPEPDSSNHHPVTPSLPLTEDRGCGKEGPAEESVGGWEGSAALSLGQMQVVRAYPKAYRPLRRMARFRELWERLHLESHWPWVVDLVDEFKSSRAWLSGHVQLIDNFLENVVGLEERPVADGCTADCCRGKWSRRVVIEAADEIKAAPTAAFKPAPLTPEQIAEMKAQARTVGKGLS